VSVTAERLEAPAPGEVVFSSGLIAGRVDELARQISGDYRGRGRELVLLTVLKGSAVFLADLSRRLTLPHRLEFMAISAYRGASTGSSGRIRLLKDIDRPVRGCDVVIVEDIVDTGLTLTYLQDIIRARSPRHVRTACLLSKPSRRKIDVKVEYVGFTIEDKFVVGYGLDYAEQYRNLPHIAVIGD
jgi:hypoxanthine phosphoribosyltransferase